MKGKLCILTSSVGKNATDKDYAAAMREILDTTARATQQGAKAASAADPTNQGKKDLADKYRCPAGCVLYFRGTITVDGYCEEGAGPAAEPGRLCQYDGFYDCLEITQTT